MFFNDAAQPPAPSLPAGRTAAPGDIIMRTSGGTVSWMHDATGDIEQIVTGMLIQTVTGDIDTSTQQNMMATAPAGVEFESPVVSTSANLVVGTGATGSFTTPTGQIVTVRDGIIVNIF